MLDIYNPQTLAVPSTLYPVMQHSGPNIVHVVQQSASDVHMFPTFVLSPCSAAKATGSANIYIDFIKYLVLLLIRLL